MIVTNVGHKCKQCGECCKNRYDMFLMPIDILRISRHFKISCKEVIETFCERDGNLEVKARTVGEDNECIFLKKDASGKKACAIYPVRPMKCYIYPLGAVLQDINRFTIDWQCAGLQEENIVSGFEFAMKMSNDRYKIDWLFHKAFIGTLEELERSGRDNEQYFEYLFYNTSEEEIIDKVTELNV